MEPSERGDIIAGVALVAIGLAVATHSLLVLDIGSVMRMGPGMFPGALGVVLVVMGLCIAVPAFAVRGSMPDVAWRPAISVLASLLAFAVLIGRSGIVPAIFALTVIASQADRRLSILATVLLAVVLSVVTAIMITSLELPIAILDW